MFGSRTRYVSLFPLINGHNISWPYHGSERLDETGDVTLGNRTLECYSMLVYEKRFAEIHSLMANVDD